MNASTRIGRDAVALALGAIVFPACVTRTFQHAIEVKRGSTVEEKLAIAKAIVTEQRLARLREELKARLPGTTDQQLARLGLRLGLPRLRRAPHNRGYAEVGTMRSSP